jgi:hypothetical protein
MTHSSANGPARPAGPSDLALPLTLVHDLARTSAPGPHSARRADEIRTAPAPTPVPASVPTTTATAAATASKRRRAGRRKAAVRRWDS